MCECVSLCVCVLLLSMLTVQPKVKGLHASIIVPLLYCLLKLPVPHHHYLK